MTRTFDIFFDLRLNKCWANTRDVGDSRCYRVHYNVIVMNWRKYEAGNPQAVAATHEMLLNDMKGHLLFKTVIVQMSQTEYTMKSFYLNIWAYFIGTNYIFMKSMEIPSFTSGTSYFIQRTTAMFIRMSIGHIGMLFENKICI